MKTLIVLIASMFPILVQASSLTCDRLFRPESEQASEGKLSFKNLVAKHEMLSVSDNKISANLFIRFATEPIETVYPIVFRLKDGLSASQTEAEIQKLHDLGVAVLTQISETLMTARAKADAIKAAAQLDSVQSIQYRARITPAH